MWRGECYSFSCYSFSWRIFEQCDWACAMLVGVMECVCVRGGCIVECDCDATERQRGGMTVSCDSGALYMYSMAECLWLCLVMWLIQSGQTRVFISVLESVDPMPYTPDLHLHNTINIPNYQHPQPLTLPPPAQPLPPPPPHSAHTTPLLAAQSTLQGIRTALVDPPATEEVFHSPNLQ